MCGRFALNRGLGQLRQQLGIQQLHQNDRTFVPSNNIAPRQIVPVVANAAIELMIWGSQRGNFHVINAVSETVGAKFRKDVQERRCVIPADGYFEWTKEKQPYFFKQFPDDLMFFAGIYTAHNQVMILTRAATDSLTWIHHRMPVILTGDQIQAWQSPDWKCVLDEVPPVLSWYPVARAALKLDSKGEECVRKIDVKRNTQKRLDAMLQVVTKKEMDKILAGKESVNTPALNQDDAVLPSDSQE
jgi:putative SOS response-associated peptidase YedK